MYIYCKYCLTKCRETVWWQEETQGREFLWRCHNGWYKKLGRSHVHNTAKKQITGVIKSTCDAVASKKFLGITEKLWHLVAHGINGGRALQDVLTTTHSQLKSWRDECSHQEVLHRCVIHIIWVPEVLESFLESKEINNYVCEEKWNYTKDE